jgi:hypothetical protein
LILEGIPALIGGIATLFYLTDWPKNAQWLSVDEREWISDELERENHEKAKDNSHLSVPHAFGNRREVGRFKDKFASPLNAVLNLVERARIPPSAEHSGIALSASIAEFPKQPIEEPRTSRAESVPHCFRPPRSPVRPLCSWPPRVQL